MNGFLEQVASCLHHAYGNELERYCIVFPNKRAGLYFRKYLSQLSKKPVWSPSFRSLGSLMEEISGLTQTDNLSLIFHLFQAFKLHHPTKESFEDFYFWGEMLLDDFDDIDKHRVDARDLFRNLSDLKEIDRLFDYLTEEQKDAIRVFWQDFKGGPSSSLKADFATIWTSLYPIYHSFKQRLMEKSLGYEGMIQREAVRLLDEGNAAYTPCEKYVFIGFNALTACEEFFFETLQKQKRAIFFWDYDDYYLNNTWHEAGTFMRKNLYRFPPEWKFDTRNLTDTAKRIEIISVPSDTGQTKLAGQLLEEIYAQEKTQDKDMDWNRTAVVLPDEYLLLPMFSSLPETACDINITMGYPFTCTPANSLFERLASLQQHIRQYDDGPRFYHHDVCMILHHPYIQRIVPLEANVIIRTIIEYNRIYVPPSEISQHELLQMIFRQCTHAREFSEYLLEITSRIVACNIGHQTSDIRHQTSDIRHQTSEIGNRKSEIGNLDYLYTFFFSLQRLHDILTTDEIDMEIQVFCRLLRKVFASLKIPFSGEPLKGLQLMGMLETRALDFDHVMILSMNEGIFPKGNPRQSFIPYNLRKGFGLTTSERRDAVSAYHFYRLIQRATDIRLIYNSASANHNAGEMSRFLSQLIYEPAFSVQKRNITFRVNIDRDIPIIKERTDDVRRILGLYLSDTDQARSLSPSALNSYLDCPLKFYFRYVDGLKEKEEVTDEIDYSVFGKLLHKTMELIYQPYLKKEITADILVQLQKDRKGIQEALYRAFAEEYFHTAQVTDDDITGRNIIIYEVLLKYIMRILEIDRDASPFTLLSLEEPLRVNIPILCNGNAARLNLHGYIDRLDYASDTLRIIDYKTGNAQRNFTAIADLFDRSKTGNHAVLQTLVYACMTHMVHPEYPRITSGLYVMRDIFKRDKEYDPRINISRQPPIDNYFDVAAEFETELNRLLLEIFLSDKPFSQTDNAKKCLNCLYADMCHRKNCF